MSRAATQIRVESAPRRPRLGFVGLGWIGRNRLQSVAEAGVAEIAAIYDVQASAVGVDELGRLDLSAVLDECQRLALEKSSIGHSDAEHQLDGAGE